MMQYTLKFSLIVVAVILSQSVLAQNTLTISQAMLLAEKNAPSISMQGLAIQAANIQAQLAERSRMPSASGQYSGALNLGRSIDPFSNQFLTQSIVGNNYGISANYLLFNGGQVAKQIERAKLFIRASSLQSDAEKNQIRLQTLISYVEVLLTTERKRLLAAQLAASKEQISYFKKLYDADRLRLVALKRLEIEASRIEGQQLEAELQYQQSIQVLNRLTGFPIGKSVKVQELAIPTELSLFPYGIEEVLEGALKQLPDLQALRVERQIRQKEEELVYATRLPELMAISNVGTTYSSAARRFENNEAVKINYPRQFFSNLNTAIGFTLSIPIFNSVNYKLQHQAAKVESRMADKRLRQRELEIRGLIEESYAIMQAITTQYTNQKKRIIVLAEIVNISTLGFQEGRADLNDFLQSKQNLEQAQLQIAQLEYEYILRKKILTFYQTGKWE